MKIFIINKWGLNTQTKLFLNYKFNEEKKLEESPYDEEDDDENQRDKSKEKLIALKDIINENTNN